MIKINSRWGPNMMHRSSQEAQQVFCTTGDQGSEWIHSLDDLPAPVRRRLAESRWNICPACVAMDARSNTPGLRRAPISVYFAVVEAVELRLDGDRR